jgi:hypothetical protein
MSFRSASVIPRGMPSSRLFPRLLLLWQLIAPSGIVWANVAPQVIHFNLDPGATEKRLGDAYYEQQLVRDQLLQLRGKTDYKRASNFNAEYQALLEAGAAYAAEFQLSVRFFLSAV